MDSYMVAVLRETVVLSSDLLKTRSHLQYLHRIENVSFHVSLSHLVRKHIFSKNVLMMIDVFTHERLSQGYHLHCKHLTKNSNVVVLSKAEIFSRNILLMQALKRDSQDFNQSKIIAAIRKKCICCH